MQLSEYPKTYDANMAWRLRIMSRAKIDPLFRQKVKELFHRDVLFAFNAFFFTLDPRRRPMQHQPFCTYEYQDKGILEIVDCIDRGEDVLGEKSRDMGFSWTMIGIYVWFWLKPEGGTDFLLGSRIEDYVDKKGDMRTLMEKARYLVYRLPQWLRPRGFRPKLHDNFMRLWNIETGSSITGESNNANFSTGGRYLSIFFDEFAKWESTDKAAWTSAGDATRSRIPNSTPFGAGGQYYELVTDGKTRKIRWHWSLHPLKAEGAYCIWPKAKDLEEEENEEAFWRSPWYDRECARRTPEEIEQELNIGYVGSGSPVFKGKAAKRIGTLLRRGKDAVAWYEPMLGEKTLRNVLEPRENEGYLVVYEEPIKDRIYAFGVDVVEGVEGGDYAVIKILNRMTKSVAASYFSRIDEVLLASVVSLLSEKYTTFEAPWVGIETIGPGLATFDLCVEAHEVPNLFMMPTYDQSKNSVSYKKGFRTGTSSRNKLVGEITSWLIDGGGWGDSRLIREMTTFVRDKSGKPKAKAGTNDDEVLAFGIALCVDDIAPFSEKATEIKRREDGLPENVFELKAHKKKEPESLEERCMASLLAKRAAADAMQREFYEDEVESLYG